jgi:hypothetical protein
MLQVPGLSAAVNSDQPVMHLTKLDSPTPSAGPSEPSTDAAVVNGPGPGCVEVP